MSTAQDIAQLLVEQNIVQVNFKEPFLWTSGIQSPIYCDCRELISLPQARDTVVTALIQKMQELNQAPDYIAGTATAGIPWAAFVAQELNIPMLYVRGKPKGHGTGKMVEGRGVKNSNVVVIEDAFSTGSSSIISTKALQNELNANIEYIFGIFSWDTPAATKNAQEADVALQPLTKFEDIVQALLGAEKITPEQKEDLKHFHSNPEGWRD